MAVDQTRLETYGRARRGYAVRLEIVGEELEKIHKQVGDNRYDSGNGVLAISLFEELITSDTFAEFLTLKAYDRLLSLEKMEN